MQMQLSKIEKEFIDTYKIPSSALFNAEGIRRKDYEIICKGKDIPFVYNTTPCKKHGHRLRTRRGHCMICNPGMLLHYKQYLTKDDKKNSSFNYSIPNKFNGDFVAVDFETATSERNSICAVGIVEVKKYKFVNKLYLLVQPPCNKYWKKYTKIHGINETHTCNESHFDKHWDNISKYFKNKHVVAHNANFDLGCLNNTLNLYGLNLPKMTQNCTYKIYKERLVNLCKRHKIKINHHNALSDAEACAKLYIMHLKNSLNSL